MADNPFDDSGAMAPETFNPFSDWTKQAAQKDVGTFGALGAAAQNLWSLPERALTASAQDVQHLGEQGYEPQSVGPATETALNMVGGAGVVPAEANAFRTGIGINAKTFNPQKFEQFKRLEDKGVSPSMNYAMSGWYRGADNQPRFWLPDQGAKLTDDAISEKIEGHAEVPKYIWKKDPSLEHGGLQVRPKLGDIWDHPRLYDAYPWLKDIPVRPETNPEWGGHFDPNTGAIHIANGRQEFFEDSLHHEVVHAIQQHEGFSPGTNATAMAPKEFPGYETKIAAMEQDIAKKAADAGLNHDLAWVVSNMGKDDLDEYTKPIFDRLQSEGLVDKYRDLTKAKKAAQSIKDDAYQRYLHAHGESEARDAPFIRRNPESVPRGGLPLHVNPELQAGRPIMVLPREGFATGGAIPMADGGTFDPNEFSAFKQQAAPPAFDPNEFAASKPPDQSPSLTDRALSFGKGIARGAEGFAGDLGQAVMGPFGPQAHMQKLLYDTGLSKTAPQTTPEYGQQLAQKTGMTDKNPGYEGAIGEAIGNPSTYFGPGGIMSKMIMGAAGAAGGEAATDLTGSDNPLVRTAGSMIAGPLAARTLKPQLAPAQQMLADQGVTQMTPGQLMGGKFKNLEDAVTSAPILGDFIQAGRNRSIEGFNRAVGNQALEPINQRLAPGTAAGHDTIAEVRDKLSTAYDHIVPYLELRPDPQWYNDLRNIYGRNVQMLPEAHQQQFQRIINQEFGRPGTPLSGEQVKVIESNINRLARKFSGSNDANQQLLGEALESTLTAVRSNMQRMNPIFAAELGSINQGYAMYTRMRAAAANRRGSEGVFTPGDLLTAIKRGDTSVGKGAFARGDALMQRFAEAGQRVLPSTLADSGTAKRLMTNVIGGGGAAYISPKILAAAGAASVPYLRPSMYLLNRYMSPTTGVRAGYSNAGRGVGSLRPLMASPFGVNTNPFTP
jgi:hypothetical protein